MIVFYELILSFTGEIPRPPPLPEWTDIKEYLQYLNLDEPIIGKDDFIPKTIKMNIQLKYLGKVVLKG